VNKQYLTKVKNAELGNTEADTNGLGASHTARARPSRRASASNPTSLGSEVGALPAPAWAFPPQDTSSFSCSPLAKYSELRSHCCASLVYQRAVQVGWQMPTMTLTLTHGHTLGKMCCKSCVRRWSLGCVRGYRTHGIRVPPVSVTFRDHLVSITFTDQAVQVATASVIRRCRWPLLL